MYTQVYNAMKSRHLPSTKKLSPRSYYRDEQINKYIERLYIINQRQA
jgi:predicted DNA-binding transcriptional regulator AlpA